MTPKLVKIPKHWLNPVICGRIFEIFRKRIEYGEPIPPFDTRYPGKLEAIIESVRQTYGGKYLNLSVLEAASAYLNQLVRGHAFSNGNKRMAVLFTHFFLLRHGLDLSLTAADLYNFTVYLARAGERGISPEDTKDWCRRIIGDFSIDLNGKTSPIWHRLQNIWKKTRRK
jgi:death-on-curing family protein